MSDVPGAGPIPPPPPKPGASVPERGEAARNRRRLALFAAGLALFIFLSVGAYWTSQYMKLYESQLRTVERLRASDTPLTYGDVVASYPMPPAEGNGAFAYRDAAAVVGAAWDALSKEEKSILRDAANRIQDGAELGSESKEAASAFLEDAAATWDHLAEFQRFSTARFPLNPRDPDLLEHIGIQPIRNLSVLHCFAILRALENNDIDHALDMLESEGRLEKGLHGAPCLLGFLIRNQAIKEWTQNASVLLNADGIAAGHLRRIADAVPINLQPGDHIRSLDYEIAFALYVSKHRPNTQSAGEDLAFLRRAYSQGPFAYASTRLSRNSSLNLRLVSADLMVDLREALSTSYPEKFKRIEEIVADSQRGGFSRIYARAFIPSTAKSVKTVARTNAALDALRVAIDIERYRLATGAVPDTLDALVPEYRAAIPIDPFDGQPLRYRLYPADGYAVYSIGDDFDDDGAAPRRTLDDGESDGDIVIRVRR